MCNWPSIATAVTAVTAVSTPVLAGATVWLGWTTRKATSQAFKIGQDTKQREDYRCAFELAREVTIKVGSPATLGIPPQNLPEPGVEPQQKWAITIEGPDVIWPHVDGLLTGSHQKLVDPEPMFGNRGILFTTHSLCFEEFTVTWRDSSIPCRYWISLNGGMPTNIEPEEARKPWETRKRIIEERNQF